MLCGNLCCCCSNQPEDGEEGETSTLISTPASSRQSGGKTYNVYLPPIDLTSRSPSVRLPMEEMSKLLNSFDLLLVAVDNGLSNTESSSSQSPDSACRSLKLVKDMFTHEKSYFEHHFQEYKEKVQVGCTGLEILSFNCLVRECALWLCVWDMRIHALRSSDREAIECIIMRKAVSEGGVPLHKDRIAGDRSKGSCMHAGGGELKVYTQRGAIQIW